MAALVAYRGALGPGPATVEFFNGSTLLAQTSEREALPRNTQEPWSFKFRRQVVLQPGVEYNLMARIRWGEGSTEKTLDSEVVKFRLATP